jgi:hypothetical protein
VNPVEVFMVVYGVVITGASAIGITAGLASNPRGNVNKLRRLLKRARRYPIASVPQGVARMVGNVRPIDGKVINAPFSRIPCVAHVTVVKRVPVNAATGPTLMRVVGGVPFELVDATGSIVIDPSDVECLVTFQIRRDVSRWGATPDTEQFLVEHGHSWAEVSNQHFLYFEESVIRHDAQVSLAGIVERTADVRGAVSGDYRESPTALHVRGGGKTPLVISDDLADISG